MRKDDAMQTVQIELPEQLYKSVNALVKNGWFKDEKEVLYEAIRKFVESYHPELIEKFILDDVEWGLHGEE